MADYDIGAAFQAIENELMASMIRNMKHHQAEESDEGFEWSMWQSEQLKSLEMYRKENQEKFTGKFTDINAQIKALISEARAQGGMEQEMKILNQIKNGFTKFKKPSESVTAEFFHLNDRKLRALINATENDFKKAETAMLRMSNNQYRKIIFNAEVYANTGAGTYEKAVDMATRDYLARGINCIEYANGSRHTLKEYSDMAIRTATKRAYLTGEGEKREEWGIHTVIMNKRGNPCPKCLPFVGKILIDDVWSGGTAKEASETGYGLMSNAMDAGLYHPRCKDGHTTYFPGISTPPEASYTKNEIQDIEKDYDEEQKKQYANRQAEKYERLEKYSLDKENKDKYALKAAQWNQKGNFSKNQFFNLDLEKAGSVVKFDNYYANENHVNRMREIVNGATYETRDNLSAPFAYLPDEDVIAYNLTDENVNRYPEYFAITHEASHRADILEYHSWEDQKFIEAMNTCSEKIKKNKSSLQKLVEPGEIYYDDFAIQDILYTLSDGEIETLVGHTDADQLTKILETFANISTIDLLGYKSKNEFKDVLMELYTEYNRIVGK